MNGFRSYKNIICTRVFKITKQEIVSGLEKLLRRRKMELIEQNFKPMTMEQYNAEIDQALEDSKNGRMIKASDLKAKIQKWN